MIIAIIAPCNRRKNLVNVTTGDEAMLATTGLLCNIDIRITDSVSAPLMSSCDYRVQLLCDSPLGSSTVTVPSLK